MSLNLAQSFLDKFKYDKRFRSSILKAKKMDDKLKIIKSAGFDFSEEELEQALGELKSEDLEFLADNTE